MRALKYVFEYIYFLLKINASHPKLLLDYFTSRVQGVFQKVYASLLKLLFLLTVDAINSSLVQKSQDLQNNLQCSFL